MNYKRLFVFIFLVLICLPLFAGGSSEMFSGLAKGVSTGAGIGTALGGPFGSVIGAMVGGGIGAFTGKASQSGKDQVEGEAYRDKYLAAKQAEAGYTTQIEADEIGITSATNKISAYDEFISNFDNYKSLQMDNLQSEGNQQYSQLMSNFANLQTIYGATGSQGASAAISTEIGKQGVQQLAGSDLTMNRSGGGTFAKVWENTETELDDKYSSSLLSKQDLYSTIENYRASIKTNTSSKNTQIGLQSEYKTKAEDLGVKVN